MQRATTAVRFAALALLVAGACPAAACRSGSTPGPEPESVASPSPQAPPPASQAEPPFVSSDRFALLIAGGTVVDGSGEAPRVADVLVRGDRIVHVGPVDPGVEATTRIDAAGYVVAPGFIDAHSHGDPGASNRSFLVMGVTTLCIGQDGRSPGEGRLASWVRRTARRSLAVNVAPLVGHGTVRALARVGVRSKPSEDERGRMATIVAEDLAAGGWGLSTGLEYQPGGSASAAELVAVAAPVAAVGGVVMSHLRSEDDDAIDGAVDELVAQAAGSGARVHIAHLKVVYGKGVARAESLLAKLAAARAAGVHITADLYPYTASYTTIGIVFPDFAKPPEDYAVARRTRRAELAAYLRERVKKRGGPEATLFESAPYRGQTLAQVAAAFGRPFEDVLIDLGPNGASGAYFVMDEALQDRLLGDPHVVIGTDGSEGSRHPRGHGTFARVWRRYVVERKQLTVAEAVRKMSGLTAEIVGLDRAARGMLRAGWAADIAVFDPTEVVDQATYAEPTRLSRGMRWVVVNGIVAIADGKLTDRRGGRLLLRK